ncbi:hypothetical protein ACNPDB_004380, partial [Vibrio vulnificus]
RAVGSIRDLILGFFVLAAKFQSLIFKIMSHFSFFGFWLLFVNQSRVNLVFSKTKRKPLKLKHNKAFKRDSCRVVFLVCSEFWW